MPKLKRSVLLLTLLLAASSLQAKTIFVDASSGSPTSPYGTWETAAANLQDAITLSAEGDQIWVAAGTYYPDEGGSKTDNDREASFALKYGVEIYGGFAGNETELSSANPIANETILSGNIGADDAIVDNSYHVVTSIFLNASAILDGFTIQDGFASGSGVQGMGGALYNNSSSPTVRNCLFKGNSSATYGGAVYNQNFSEPTFIDCIFQNNSAAYGGALLNEGSAPTLIGCVFQSNYASVNGGAVHNFQTSAAIYRNCSFTGNTAVVEGGAAVNYVNSSPTFDGCSFKGNQAGYGGAMVNNTDCLPDILNSEFQGNVATVRGGAMLSQTRSSAKITSCTFQGNKSAGDGGAIYNATSSHLAFKNTVIWNNQAAEASNSTSASIFNDGTCIPTFTFNLVANYSKAALDASGTSPNTNFTPTNPLFRLETDPATAPNTGGDLRLQASSPLIDKGLYFGAYTDLLGNPRYHGAVTDLGAFEYQGLLYVDSSATGANDGSSWEDAFTVLQDAIDIPGSGQEIHVAAGTYYPDEGASQSGGNRGSTFQIESGSILLGGFPSGGGALYQRNPATYETILSGDIDQNDGDDFQNDGSNAYHVLTASNANAYTQLDGFTITAGNANGGSTHGSGGGLRCVDSSSPAISNCSFQGNRSSFQGGGAIYIEHSSPTFADCSFDGNQGTSGTAGAIRSRYSSSSFTDCSFTNNQATFGSGGAINSFKSSNTYTSCSFQGNQAGSNGGAIYSHTSSPTFINCSFQGNQAGNRAGAIYNNFSDTEFVNCTFQGNQAADLGGAIYNYSSSPAISNSIVWNNQAKGRTDTPHAAIENDHGFGAVTSTSVPTYAKNLIANHSKATLDATGTSPNTNLEPTDPLFISELNPASAPATRGDLRPLSNSPLIDAGSNAANTSANDLAGNARLNGAAIDLGAFEQQGILYVDENAAGSSNGTSWTNAFTTLQNAIAAATSGQEIHVAAGTYYPDEGTGQTNNDRDSTFQLKSAVSILGGFPAGGGDLASRNPAANQTILSGDIDKNDGENFLNNDANAYHVLSARNLGHTARLDGFTIEGGNADGATPRQRGGAIYCERASPTIANCSFRGNQAVEGGAIYNIFSSPEIVNCSFKENKADYGGAIANGSSSPYIANCSFQANQADNDGGAINNSNSSLFLTNCSFQGNKARFGGAFTTGGSSAVTLVNCSFQGNQAASEGGAIYNGSSTPELINCIVWNNQANGTTSTASASLFNASPASVPTFTYSLVANYSKATLNASGDSPNNNFEPTDPLFISEVDPASAPATRGDLRLRSNSPLIGAGANTLNDTTNDLAGNARLYGATIDLGAYEQQGIRYVDQNATGSKNGSSWTNAFTTLQNAIAAATSGQEIHVAAGTYYPDEGDAQTDNDRDSTFQLKSGVSIVGGFPAGGGDLSTRNPASNRTILSGDIDKNDGEGFINNGSNAYHVLTASNLDHTAILNGFTVEDGNANGTNPADRGGALFSNNASPTIENCSFLGNRANSGGAIFIAGTSSPAIVNCSFRGNLATGTGGAVYNTVSSTLFLNCSFLGNKASSGAALFTQEPASIVNGSFQGNQSVFDGGAVYTSFAPLNLTNCIIWNNQANGVTNTAVASIFNPGSAVLTFSHCLVENVTKATLDASGDSSANNFEPTDPLFVLEATPGTAPTTDGNLRLSAGSPALNTGDNSSNSSPFDLASNPRIQNSTIDLGAYEGVLTEVESWSFAPLAIDSTSLAVTLTISGGSLPENWEDALVVSSTGTADSSGLSVSGTGPAYTITLKDLSGEGSFTIALAKAAALSQGFLIEADTSSETFLRTVSTSPIHYANAANLNPVAPYDTWETAATYLQDALAFAASGDQVWVAQGTYYPDQGDAQTDDDRDASFQLKNGVAIYGGFLGDETNLADADPSSNETILSGSIDAAEEHNAFNSRHVLTATSVDATAILNGFTVRDGNATGTAGGGAILIDSASPTITNCLFQANHANYGGAIKNQSGSTPVFENCSFKENTSLSFGGAIFNGASSPVFTNCSFQGNSAPFRGGAIYSENFSDPSLTNCSFQGNSAGVDGGAISNQQSSPSLVNCSFQGNKAAVLGGAIHSNSSSSSPTLENCIVWNNEADGVSNTASASIHNEGAATTSFSHSLVDNFTAAELNNSGSSPDTNFEPTNPLFTLEVIPSTAPTTVGNLQLRLGSPAIDLGDNTANTTSTDLGGNDRIQNLTIDLGAYEGGTTQILSFKQDDSLETDETSVAINITLSEGALSTGWKDAIAIDATGTITVGDLTESGTGPNYTLTVSGIAGEGQLTVTFDPALAMAKGIIIAAASSVQVNIANPITPPVIVLRGGSAITVPFGSNWVDPAATATDAAGASVAVTIGGDTVDTTQTQGVFTITYDATDSFGNVAQQVTRQVVIVGVIDFDPDSNNKLDQLSWTDDWILQSSTDLKAWTDVPGALSPFTITAITEGQQFWRLRKAE